jgi:hemoglobin/transferrin/lactoferrin receptor protein
MKHFAPILLFSLLLFTLLPEGAALGEESEKARGKAAQAETASDESSPEEEIIRLPLIKVTATRSLRNLSEIPVSVGVVSEADYERNPGGSVADMLSDIPGAFVAGGNQPGNRKIALRGMGAEHTVIFVDGMKLEGFLDTYGPSLSISPSEIERMEVLKGPASVLYGSDAIGGVVNIITKKGYGKPVNLSLRGVWDGSVESLEREGALFGRVNDFSYRVSGAGTDARERKTPLGRLINSDHSYKNFSGKIGWEPGDLELELSYSDYRREGGLVALNSMNEPQINPDLIYTIQRTKADDRSSVRGKISWEKDSAFLKKISLIAYGEDASLDSQIDMKGGSVAAQIFVDYRSKGFSELSEWSFGKRHKLTQGFDYDLIDFSDRRNLILAGSKSSSEGKETTAALFIEDEWRAKDTLILTGGVRYNYNKNTLSLHTQNPERVRSESESKLVGSLGLVYIPSEGISLRALFSQGFRTPTPLAQLTGSGALAPNPDLVPEKSNNFELGLRVSKGGLDLDLGLYHNDLKDGIIYVSTATGSIFQNVEKKKVLGFETTLRYFFEDISLSPYLNFNLMRVTLIQNDFKTNKADKAPLFGKIGIKWDKDLTDTLSLFADLNVVMASKSSLVTHNPQTGLDSESAIRPSWQTANLTLGLSASRGDRRFFATLALKNLFDQDYIPVNAFLPEPGFHAVGSLGVEF